MIDITARGLASKNAASLAENTQQLTSKEINVKYPPAPLVGAKGDGVADDTAAFSNLINYAQTNNVKLVIPAGTFVISSGFIINTLTIMEGIDKSTCILNFTALSGDLFTIKTTARIRNLTIKISSQNTSASAFNLVAIPSANKYGLLQNITINAGYWNANTSKAIRITNDPSCTAGNQGSLYYWEWDGINTHDIKTFCSVELNTAVSWTTAGTYKNTICEGYGCTRMIDCTNATGNVSNFSGNKLINWQYQCSQYTDTPAIVCGVGNQFEFLIWDFSNVTINSSTAIKILGNSQENVINTPNGIMISQIVADTPLQKNFNEFYTTDRHTNAWIEPLVNPNFTKIMSEAHRYTYTGIQDNFLYKATSQYTVSVYNKDTQAVCTTQSLTRMFDPQPDYAGQIQGVLGQNVAIEINMNGSLNKVMKYTNPASPTLDLSLLGIAFDNVTYTPTYKNITFEYYDATNGWTQFATPTVQPLNKKSLAYYFGQTYAWAGQFLKIPSLRFRIVINNSPEDTLYIANIFGKNTDLIGNGTFLGIDGGNTYGDIAFCNAAIGPMLKSPNATYWRFLADNSGVLSTTARVSASDVQLTTTSATNIATVTPNDIGNYEASVYYRVVTAATNVTITVTYIDNSGSHTQTIVNATAQPVGVYTVNPLFFNAKYSGAITVTATAGTANQVYVSAVIKPV